MHLPHSQKEHLEPVLQLLDQYICLPPEALT